MEPGRRIANLPQLRDRLTVDDFVIPAGLEPAACALGKRHDSSFQLLETEVPRHLEDWLDRPIVELTADELEKVCDRIRANTPKLAGVMAAGCSRRSRATGCVCNLSPRTRTGEKVRVQHMPGGVMAVDASTTAGYPRGMTATAQKVLTEALQLTAEEREELVHALLDSIAPSSDAPKLSPAWDAELARRHAELMAGEAEMFDADEVLDEISRERMASEHR